MMTLRTGALLVTSGLFLFAVGSGCSGGGKESSVADAKLPTGSRTEAIEHEACNEAGNRVEALDATGDGKPDIKRVYDGKTGKELCRISDLNHDGKPDMFEYYDASGQVRRREADFDDNGVVNMIEYYENGKVVRKELDTTGQHRIDTWDFFDPATGKRIRRERDSTNDGRVDQWWAYDGDKVTIAADKNGDGKPDPDQTMVISGGGNDKNDAGGVATAPDAAPPALPPKEPESAGDAGPSLAPAVDAGGPRRKENRGGGPRK